jgi:hypothetical protein
MVPVCHKKRGDVSRNQDLDWTAVCFCADKVAETKPVTETPHSAQYDSFYDVACLSPLLLRAILEFWRVLIHRPIKGYYCL